jgi:chloride channel 7
VIFCFGKWWYRIFENELFKQDWRTRGKAQILQYICMKRLLCFLVGLIVSIIGFCNNLAVENIAGVKFVVTSNMMLEKR